MNILSNIFRFFVAVLLQVLILNHIQVSGFVVPYAYLFFILMLPLDWSPLSVILLSFITGMSIDLFSFTPGLHSSACVLLGALRMPVVRSLSSSIDIPSSILNVFRKNGFGWLLRYILTLTFIHHVWLFFFESLTFAHIVVTLLRIFSCTFASSVIILLLIYLSQPKNSRR